MFKKIENTDCEVCPARNESVFCDLNLLELNSFTTSKYCNFYTKKQYIFQEGTRPHGLYCIKSGKVKLLKIGDEGKEHIISFAKNGDILGHRAILNQDLHSYSAVTLEDSSICYIPREVFYKLVERNAGLAFNIIQLLSKELKSIERNMTDLAQKPVRERLAGALLLLYETYGIEKEQGLINVSLTREEFANLIGTATETLIRLLSEFKSDKIIELSGKKIGILNMNKLTSVANSSS